MNRRSSLVLCVLVAIPVLAGLGYISRAETPEAEAKKTKARKRVGENEPADSRHRVTLTVARDRAVQLHATIESTLHAMHRHYFPKERATVPARALEEVFADIARESRVDLRWISVNIRPMSIDHEPETDFEKRAARQLASGKETSIESVEAGTYRRAGSIALGGGCLSCHTTSFTPPSAAPKFAGLVISIPTTME
jgi:hypothetical protein